MKSIFVVFLIIVGITVESFAASFEGFPLIDSSNQQNKAAIVRIGIYDPKGDNFKGGDGIEAVFRYNPLFFLAAEAGIGYYNHIATNQFKMNTNGDAYYGDDKIQMVPLTASLKLVLPTTIGNIYVGGGGGYYFKKISGLRDETSSNTGTQYGAGIEAFITKTEMMLFDYKRINIKKGAKVSDIDFSGDVFSLGFGYRF